jgi:hypothetical protein
MDNDDVVQSYYSAQEQLIIMDSKRAPQDKLECVVTAAKAIFKMLEDSNVGTAAADEFLPVLIYVVIHANPPMLYSNLQFLDRFCDPKKLMSGETGYYFTNLYSAVSFIENLDASSLKMNEGEFFKKIHGANAYKTQNRLGNHEKLNGYLARLATLGAEQGRMEQRVAKLDAALARALALPLREMVVASDGADGDSERNGDVGDRDGDGDEATGATADGDNASGDGDVTGDGDNATADGDDAIGDGDTATDDGDGAGNGVGNGDGEKGGTLTSLAAVSAPSSTAVVLELAATPSGPDADA